MTLSLEDLIGLDPLLTARERHWRDRARDFARQHIAPIIDADSEDRRFREELIPLLGEAGLLGMHLEGYGAAGAGAVSYGLACRELEAVDSSWRTFVSVQGSLAMTAIARYGSEEHKEHWLPRMARGEAVGCFALTEPQGGSDPAATATVARFDAGEWVIDGAKRWIGLASVADVAVVWAKVEDPAYGEGARAIRGFLVPTDAPGFTATPIDGKLSMRASVQCDIRLDGVRLPAEALLPGAAGLSGPFACLNEARYGIVWGAMGAARTCLEVAVSRVSTREVFGRPLAATQLVQAQLADMATAISTGTHLALHLGRAKEAGRLLPAQISVGKLNNVREALRVAHTARALLGGDGITDLYPVMRHAANLEAVRTYEGTDEMHQLVIGRALTGHDAF